MGVGLTAEQNPVPDCCDWSVPMLYCLSKIFIITLDSAILDFQMAQESQMEKCSLLGLCL